MYSYYSILEQMKYHVIGNRIFNKDTFEEYKVKEYSCLADVLYLSDNGNTIKIYPKEGTLHINGNNNKWNINCGGKNVENEIYNVNFNARNRSVTISVCLFPIEEYHKEESCACGLIKVLVTDRTREFERQCGLSIYQQTTIGRVYSEIANSANGDVLQASDCNQKTYMNYILRLLNSDKEIANSIDMQNCIKYILPSLKQAISDMLKYWKKNAIYKEIVLREKLLNEIKAKETDLSSKIKENEKELAELIAIRESLSLEKTK